MASLTILRNKITYLGNQVSNNSITPTIVAEIMELLAQLNETLAELVNYNDTATKNALKALENKITEECIKAMTVAKFDSIIEAKGPEDSVTIFDEYFAQDSTSLTVDRPRIVYYKPDDAFYTAFIAHKVSGGTSYNFYKKFDGVEKYMADGVSRKTTLYVDNDNQIYFFVDGLLKIIGMSNQQIEDIATEVDTLADSAVKSANTDMADLCVIDESGNAVVAVKDGHIKTKYFDSSDIHVDNDLPVKGVEIPEVDESGNRPAVDGADFKVDGDLALADEYGNVVLLLKDGHVQTKKFNSADFDPEAEQNMATSGLTISFLGDSITTYSGFIPDGYAKFYPSGDVNAVAKCYWKRVADQLQLRLGVNASWSGSYVHGPGTSTESASAGCSDARINALEANGTPDIIVVHIGINDFDEGTSLGNYTADDAWLENGTYNDFSHAYALMLQKLMKKYPSARIFVCTLMDASFRDADGAYPTVRADGAKLADFNACIRNLVTAYGLNLVDMHSCGIRWGNMHQYYVDTNLHPNTKGHILMSNLLKNEILKFY